MAASEGDDGREIFRRRDPGVNGLVAPAPGVGIRPNPSTVVVAGAPGVFGADGVHYGIVVAYPTIALRGADGR